MCGGGGRGRKTSTKKIHCPTPSYDEGLVGGAALYFGPALGLSDADVGAAVAAGKAGALVGSCVGAAVMARSGRRAALALVSAAFLVGPAAMAAAHTAATLITGRLIVGVGIGAAAVAVPTYLAELAPRGVRGRVVQSFEAALAAGMLAAALADAALAPVRGNWRWMVGLPIVPAVALAAGIVLLPESPRWLVVAGRLDAALAVIHRVLTSRRLPADGGEGGVTVPAAVEAELLSLWSAVEKERAAEAEAARARRRVTPPRRVLAAGGHSPPQVQPPVWACYLCRRVGGRCRTRGTWSCQTGARRRPPRRARRRRRLHPRPRRSTLLHPGGEGPWMPPCMTQWRPRCRRV